VLRCRNTDIRTLFILFLLSFVDADSSTTVKAAFLEQKRGIFLAAFKGLAQDSYPVVRKVLEVCWSGIWTDPKIARTLKIALFHEGTIAHVRLSLVLWMLRELLITASMLPVWEKMLKLYDRAAPEGDDPEQIPADVVHHFLLAICTRRGTGICFVDRGWYPRVSDDGVDEQQGQRGGKVHNKILGNVLRTLKVNEDPRQQELALRIMAACPELVAG
jgi:nucleolar pre-ribosomal-associated protein 1